MENTQSTLPSFGTIEKEYGIKYPPLQGRTRAFLVNLEKSIIHDYQDKVPQARNMLQELVTRWYRQKVRFEKGDNPADFQFFLAEQKKLLSEITRETRDVSDESVPEDEIRPDEAQTQRMAAHLSQIVQSVAHQDRVVAADEEAKRQEEYFATLQQKLYKKCPVDVAQLLARCLLKIGEMIILPSGEELSRAECGELAMAFENALGEKYETDKRTAAQWTIHGIVSLFESSEAQIAQAIFQKQEERYRIWQKAQTFATKNEVIGFLKQLISKAKTINS